MNTLDIKSDPTDASKEALALAIKNLDEKHTQRFDANDRAVQLAREEVKTAARDLAKSQGEALAAALKATTEANTKLEQSFEKSNGATNEKIDRLTERINIWTGRDTNQVESKQDGLSGRGLNIQVLVVIMAFAAIIISLLPHFKP